MCMAHCHALTARKGLQQHHCQHLLCPTPTVLTVTMGMSLTPSRKKRAFGTYLLNAAHGLEIDVVAFPRSQRRVPETLVSPVVTHGKGGWLRQVSRGQLSSEVIWWPSAKSRLIGDGDLVALHGTCFSLCSVRVQLLNNDLISTSETEKDQHFFKVTC